MHTRMTLHHYNSLNALYLMEMLLPTDAIEVMSVFVLQYSQSLICFINSLSFITNILMCNSEIT